MAFRSLIDELRAVRNSGDGNHKADAKLVFSLRKQPALKNGSPRFMIYMILDASVVKEAHLLEGDCIDLRYDNESRAGQLVRVAKDGYKLQKGKGGARRYHFQATFIPTLGLPTEIGYYPIKECVIGANGIEFNMPVRPVAAGTKEGNIDGI